MENFALRGVVLFQDSIDVRATAPLMATLKRLQSQNFSIAVVDTFGDAEELQQSADRTGLEYFRILPLDVRAGRTAFVEMEKQVKQLQPTQTKLVVYITNLDIALRLLGVDTTVQLLRALSHGQLVVTSTFQYTCNEVDQRRLHAACSTTFHIYSKGAATICETRTLKKDGSYGHTIEQFTIDLTSLALRCSAYTPPSAIEAALAEERPPPSHVFGKTTFDMGFTLTDEERKAKRATKLPYTNAQNEEGLVTMNIAAGRKVRAGGTIVYAPDADDDFDDDDPDDDLEI